MSGEIKVLQDDILLVVDIQNDFCPGGALAVPHGDETVPIVNRLMTRFAHVGLTQDWHPPGHISFASAHPGKAPLETIEISYGDQILWPDHCIAGSRGADFHPNLETRRGEFIIKKGFHPTIDSYSTFWENDHLTPTGLTGYLRERGIRRVFLAGLATDFCVLYSALDGRKAGFDMFVFEEAVRGIDVAGSEGRAWKSMADSGVMRISRIG